MTNQPTRRAGNRLLSCLAPDDAKQLSSQLTALSLPIKHVLYEAHAPIDFVYFPQNCVLSAVMVMEDGDGIEVGTIGNEGAAGLTAFIGPAVSPQRLIAQIAGDCLRIEAAALEKQARRSRTLFELLLRHHQAFSAQIAQSVACNGLHPLLKRCCRWLLMTHDRVEGDELTLTHEFLSYMLGVRRPGVTEALQGLQAQGLIDNSRGTITIVNRRGLEAAACECYRIVAKEYEKLLGRD